MTDDVVYPAAVEALDLYRRGQVELDAAMAAAQWGSPQIELAHLAAARAAALFAASTAAANLALLGPVNSRRRNPDPSLPGGTAPART